MEDLPYERKCKLCGKLIFITPQWVYRHGNHYYCSWKCFNKHPAKKSKHKIIIPKIGDTIRILSMYGCDKEVGKTGVVKSIDYLGQLHGTWGKWQLIPGKDSYEIIGEEENGK